MVRTRRRRRPGRRLSLGAALLAAVASPLFPASTLRAQIPSKFENLKVLPKDISRDSLVSVMRGFALGLGVRCQFCHVGKEGQPFSKWNFKSDDKAAKRKARFMLRMVDYLNRERLPTLPARADASREDPPVTVTCRTCHRGIPVPRPLGDVLELAARRSGLDSAVAVYGDLRRRYYGSGSYDFGERTLVELADRLVDSKRIPEAVRFLQLNLEQYPESVPTYVALSRAHEAAGDRSAAVAALEKATSLRPDDRRIRSELERLRKEGT
ncbi:MAG: c-type cytochrome [Candidatus Palauibacterales bacterium]|nr:c-type cytochrome [Candidatus Palauibacterales bacterium]MDP2528165.1 c-type cytochrome [Candidatus Palauibacterales bacterium]MDP2584217.1 c-type cytochrome [Candidatus Palauibacterales bacterium]